MSVILKPPKIVLEKVFGDTLEWPEWPGQFLASVDKSGEADIVEMTDLKTSVFGKAKTAMKGVEYYGQMVYMPWQTLAHDFGRPESVVNAKLRDVYAYLFTKPHDSVKIMKYFQVVSVYANVLTQFGYGMDISLESVLKIAVGKLPKRLKIKCFAYLDRYDTRYKSRRVLSA